MQLIPGEKAVSSSKNHEIQLTNVRIYKIQKQGAHTEVMSIPLTHLSSAKIRARNPKFLLYIGIAFFVLGAISAAVAREATPLVGMSFIAIVFAVVYFILKKEFFEFTADGGEKMLSPAKDGLEVCMSFVNQVIATQALVTGAHSKAVPDKTAS